MISRLLPLVFSSCLALHSPTAAFTLVVPAVRLAVTRSTYAPPLPRHVHFAIQKDDDEALTSEGADSIWVKLNEAGMTLKPKAIAAKEKTESASTTTTQKMNYALQSSILYALFIVYRAFRGFCVILPAVFTEVRRKLRLAMEQPVAEEDLAVADDINPKTGKVRLRTSIVVTILASIVTVKYIVSGLFRVVGKLVMRGSFSAAADEVADVENEMMYMTKEPGGINGDTTGTLAP